MQILESLGICASLLSTYYFGSDPFYGSVFAVLSSFLGLIVYIQSQALGHILLNAYYMLSFTHIVYKTSKTTQWECYQHLPFSVLCSLGLVFFLIFLSCSQTVVFYDFLSLVSAIFATELMRRGYIEHWGVWIVHNMASALLNYQKELFLFAFKKALYLVLGLRGYLLWRKNLRHF